MYYIEFTTSTGEIFIVCSSFDSEQTVKLLASVHGIDVKSYRFLNEEDVLDEEDDEDDIDYFFY